MHLLGNGSWKCSIDEKSKINYTYCFSGTFLENKNCLICNFESSKCIINESSPYKN